MLKRIHRSFDWKLFRNRPRRRNRYRHRLPTEHLESRILLTGGLNPPPDATSGIESTTVDRPAGSTVQDIESTGGKSGPARGSGRVESDSEMENSIGAEHGTEESVEGEDPAIVYGIQNTWTLAQMSNLAYIGASGATVSAEQVSGSLPEKLTAAGWTAVKITSNARTGFHAVLFKNSRSGQQVLAFAGTQFVTAQDWVNNTRQSMGLEAAQYTQAIQMGQQLMQEDAEHSAETIAFTGHSLGGGLASATALVTDIPATTFNAAGIHRNTVEAHGIDLSNADDLIDAYRVYWRFGPIPADPLSALQTGTHVLGLPIPDYFQLFTGNTGRTIVIRLPLLPSVSSLVNPHGMSAVLEAGNWDD